jgi:hypothetical protein
MRAAFEAIHRWDRWGGSGIGSHSAFGKVVLCGVGGNQHPPQDRFKLSLAASRDKN